MNNIISYLVGLDSNARASYLSGESIDINPSPDSKELIMKNNYGKEERLELKFPISPYAKTNSTGIYKLIEKSGDKTKQTMFSVNFPTNSESNINKDAKSTENNIKLNKTETLGVDMQPLLIIAILITVIAEWMVYIYGY